MTQPHWLKSINVLNCIHSMKTRWHAFWFAGIERLVWGVLNGTNGLMKYSWITLMAMSDWNSTKKWFSYVIFNQWKLDLKIDWHASFYHYFGSSMLVDGLMFIPAFTFKSSKKSYWALTTHIFFHLNWYTDCEIPSGSVQIRKYTSLFFNWCAK